MPLGLLLVAKHRQNICEALMRFREAGIGLQSFLEMVLSQRQLALLQEDAAKVDVANRIFWIARGGLCKACARRPNQAGRVQQITEAIERLEI